MRSFKDVCSLLNSFPFLLRGCPDKKLSLDVCNIVQSRRRAGRCLWHCRRNENEGMCVSDLEDDVWGPVSDSADGALLHLHRSHLQRVFQQKPQHFQLRLAREAHVRQQRVEVSVFPFIYLNLKTHFDIPVLFFLASVHQSCQGPSSYPWILWCRAFLHPPTHSALTQYGQHTCQTFSHEPFLSSFRDLISIGLFFFRFGGWPTTN